VEKWSETERLTREKQILGFFISGHPLDRFREDVALFDGTVNTATLGAHRDAKVELACVLTEVVRQISKKDGSEWGRLTVEDFHGTATVLAFGESWARCKEALRQDAPVLIRGAVSNRERDEEDPPIFLDSVVALATLREHGEIGVCLELGSDGAAPDSLAAARRVLAEHPGAGPVTVVWCNDGGASPEAPRLRSRSLRVTPRDDLLNALRDTLGAERVRLVRA
jgi:DNA polymerase-3 subunit alpha